MDEHYGRPFVQSGEQWIMPWLAQIRAGVVGQEHDAVGVEFVECTNDFRDRLVDVRQRNGGEKPEPVRLGGGQVRGVIIQVA
jgi:hypothetical protein